VEWAVCHTLTAILEFFSSPKAHWQFSSLTHCVNESWLFLLLWPWILRSRIFTLRSDLPLPESLSKVMSKLICSLIGPFRGLSNFLLNELEVEIREDWEFV
jgi:hypothetical protein